MFPLRKPPVPHRPRSNRDLLTWVAIVLALSVLACDEEKTLTAPLAAEPQSPGTTAPVTGDVTAMGTIPLPINQTFSGLLAFGITQTGTGRAGMFRINNSSNPSSALDVSSNGSSLLKAALFASSTGRGSAGRFTIANPNNSAAAVEASTTGIGPAGLFQINNTVNSKPALQAQTNGTGSAVQALATGRFGPVARFEANHSGYEGTAVEIISRGLESRGGLRVELTAGGNANSAIFARATNGTALRAEATEAFSAAAVFIGDVFANGDVFVRGTLTKDAGSFRIDHPLDPEHKYLSHSFVESPDMMNVYNGNVTLDENGRATVELPDYFEALNRDFRYQLTAIGAPGPNLYVAEGVKGNRFRIAGGRPYAHVSWQVTGVRQDTYANEHRIKVEDDKPREEKSVERLVARR
jgi:hypothetical protein